MSMVFDYYTLQDFAEDGTKLGNWKGKSVFACTKGDLKHKGNGAFYIVYDDDNKLVGKQNGDFYEYGTVDKHGTVHEHGSVKGYGARRTNVPKPSGEKKPKADMLVGDVKTGLDVDAVLKSAREMTVEDLLRGFNYGL